MSSLTEMNEALRRQTSHGQWAANVDRPRAGLIETLVRARKRRRTVILLRQLDSRLLDDIGITRGDIDQIATKAAAEAVVLEGARAMSSMARFVRLPAAIWTGLAKAWRRQSAIMALQRLSNHTLADIGIERGRIAEVVDSLMAQGTATAAPVRVQPATATAKPVETAVPAHKVAA
jgi:uncharacterized protein YjiS (DUF1127 family)